MTQICDMSFTLNFHQTFSDFTFKQFEKQKLNFITTEIMKMKINLDLILLYVHGPFSVVF